MLPRCTVHMLGMSTNKLNRRTRQPSPKTKRSSGPIEIAFFCGKMPKIFKSRPHFSQMFGQDNVCFAVATITCFWEIGTTTRAVSGPPGLLFAYMYACRSCWFISLKALYASISLTSFIPFIDLFHLCHCLAPLHGCDSWCPSFSSNPAISSGQKDLPGPQQATGRKCCRFKDLPGSVPLWGTWQATFTAFGDKQQFNSYQLLAAPNIIIIVDCQTMSPHTLGWPPQVGPRSAHIAIGSRKGAFVWKMCGWMLTKQVCQVTVFKLEWPGYLSPCISGWSICDASCCRLLLPWKIIRGSQNCGIFEEILSSSCSRQFNLLAYQDVPDPYSLKATLSAQLIVVVRILSLSDFPS